MKKLFVIISLLFAFIGIQAQESSTYDNYLGYDQTWFTYAQPATSYANTATDSIWYYTVLKESKMPLRYDVKVRLDSTGGTYKTVPIILQGKKFDSDSYTNLTTVYWVTGADTVKTFTQATPGQYRYYRLYIKANAKGFIFKIPELSFKFWEQ